MFVPGRGMDSQRESYRVFRLALPVIFFILPTVHGCWGNTICISPAICLGFRRGLSSITHECSTGCCGARLPFPRTPAWLIPSLRRRMALRRRRRTQSGHRDLYAAWPGSFRHTQTSPDVRHVAILRSRDQAKAIGLDVALRGKLGVGHGSIRSLSLERNQ